MADFYSLLKTTTAYKSILKDKKAGKLSHAYLIINPDKEFSLEYLKIIAKLISCSSDSGEEKMESVSIPIGFKRISDKHCSETIYTGILTAISNKNAVLKTDVPIAMLENISLCADHEVFCKVIGESREGLILRFTAGHTDFLLKR